MLKIVPTGGKDRHLFTADMLADKESYTFLVVGSGHITCGIPDSLWGIAHGNIMTDCPQSLHVIVVIAEISNIFQLNALHLA